jgi:hypothetical protein
MRSSMAVGGVAAIVFGLAGLVATMLQISQQSLGFEDTDDPAVNLAFLREHLDNYLQQGLSFMLMALALTIVVFALWDVLVAPAGNLGLRTVSSIGLAGALCLFLFGVFRYGVRPLLYIDSLDSDWGEASYLVQQIAGVHGVAQGGILAMSGWAVGVAILASRSGALPRWLTFLAILPGVRLVSGVGPLLGPDGLPGETWIVAMLSIPGSFVWFVLLGAVLLRRGLRSTRRATAAPSIATA